MCLRKLVQFTIKINLFAENMFNFAEERLWEQLIVYLVSDYCITAIKTHFLELGSFADPDLIDTNVKIFFRVLEMELEETQNEMERNGSETGKESME